MHLFSGGHGTKHKTVTASLSLSAAQQHVRWRATYHVEAPPFFTACCCFAFTAPVFLRCIASSVYRVRSSAAPYFGDFFRGEIGGEVVRKCCHFSAQFNAGSLLSGSLLKVDVAKLFKKPLDRRTRTNNCRLTRAEGLRA